jgi:methionine-rich copper-binding protein CopC
VTGRLALQIAAAAALLVASAGVAMAHAELQSSSPAPGSNLDAPPDEVTLTFDEELDPDASTFRVTDEDAAEVGGGSVDLSVADRNVLTGTVAIDAPGLYTVTYAVTSVDGHEVDGSFSFGYRSNEEVPDTAAPADGTGWLILLGLALIGISLPIARRRLVR